MSRPAGHPDRRKRMIYEVFGTDAHRMTMDLLEGSGAAAMFPAGASVALKPNLVTDGTPESGATTHAGVLSGCIEFLRGIGIRDISVIEGSWVGARTDRAMKACGYDKVCERYGVPFFDLKKDETVTLKTPLRNMEICRRALEADVLIDLPVLKGHCQTLMTCALKNLKGCLPDREKRRFHAEGLMEPIAALASALRPKLIIVDSLCGDLNFEEGGNPVRTDRMYLGTDPVQIDAYGCRLMGLDLSDVPYIGLAEAWGAGSTALTDADIVRLNEPLPGTGYPLPSGHLRRLARVVKEDSACSACYASLARALYQADEEGLPVKGPVCIGQGWRGKSPEGLGIGRCAAGAARSVPGCPPTASAVLEKLRELAWGTEEE